MLLQYLSACTGGLKYGGVSGGGGCGRWTDHGTYIYSKEW